MNREKQPLYRKENKRALHHRSNDPGSEFRYERNTKEMNNFEGTHKPIKSTRGGQDYTPLYKFLLSKVGQTWNEVYSEAVSRLDDSKHIFYMVQLDPLEQREVVRLGESSQYSGLTVKDGILIKINPDAQPWPASCSCCTHTFNGKPMKQKEKYVSNEREMKIDYDQILRETKRKKDDTTGTVEG